MPRTVPWKPVALVTTTIAVLLALLLLPACCCLRKGMPAVKLPESEAAEIDMSEVGLFDLIDAFRNALTRYKLNHPQSIELKRMLHKISDKMSELYGKLKEKSPIRLQWFLEGRDRDELIAIFLGTLELVRLGGISLQQSDPFGDILLAKTEATLDEQQFAVFDQR